LLLSKWVGFEFFSCEENESCYRVAKTHEMPYLYRSIFAKEPYNQWFFCGKRPATQGIFTQWIRNVTRWISHVTQVNTSCHTVIESCHAGVLERIRLGIEYVLSGYCQQQVFMCASYITNCNTLHHIATHCNTLLHAATCSQDIVNSRFVSVRNVQRTATHCNILQHTATRCDTLQHTATHCNTLQHTATHCNTHALRIL